MSTASEARMHTRRLVIAITGATGSVYARSFLKHVIPHYDQIYVVVSENARGIMRDEIGTDDVCALSPGIEKVTVLDSSDLGAAPASGSHAFEAMVIVPCSMGTVGRIASGISNDLITRTADVCLKEGRKLVLVPRETPLSQIHLENMLKLARAGAVILPASPPFYHGPETIDDLINAITARILSQLRIEQTLVKEWKA
jgi:flavin prenyltransferase